MAKDGLDARAAAQAEGVQVLGREQWQPQINQLDFTGYYRKKGDSSAKRLRFLAGRAMDKLKNKAPAKEVMEYLRTNIAART
jgi:hypothetical protein